MEKGLTDLRGSVDQEASDPDTLAMEKQAGTLRKQVLLAFQAKDRPLSAYSPLPLAFLGDAVYSLVVRTFLLAEGNRQAEKLHRESSRLVNARAQARAAEAILPCLTEEEKRIYRRGRNANPAHHAKGASLEDYLKATGLETLCGYLYMKDETGRLLFLIRKGLEQEQKSAGQDADPAPGRKAGAGKVNNERNSERESESD